MPLTHQEITNSIAKQDPELAQTMEREFERQRDGLEMIASENYTSPAVMAAQGSCLTNKYAEGYPHKRYYGGCEFVDQTEALAIARAKKLFKADHANVQPHSGSGANMAVYLSALKPGETVLGMQLSHGGHLTHGSPVNFSGSLFRAVHYDLNPDTGLIDYDRISLAGKKRKAQNGNSGVQCLPQNLRFFPIP